MMSVLSAFGGWGLLILLLAINARIVWKVVSRNFWWSIVFVIGVIGAFILAVITEPNCGCLSGYTAFAKITDWIAGLIDKLFWVIANYFLFILAAIAFNYWVRGRHPMASRFFWQYLFNFVLSYIWWRLNFVYVKCICCPLICGKEVSWKIVEQCMLKNFW